MTAITGALCAGQPELWEATDTASHAEAKAICEVCPAFLACRDLLHDEPRKLGTPSGTWAGILVGSRKKPEPRLPREHGTTRGYYQHKNRDEDACLPCCDAMKADTTRRRHEARNTQVSSPDRKPVRDRIGAQIKTTPAGALTPKTGASPTVKESTVA